MIYTDELHLKDYEVHLSQYLVTGHPVVSRHHFSVLCISSTVIPVIHFPHCLQHLSCHWIPRCLNLILGSFTFKDPTKIAAQSCVRVCVRVRAHLPSAQPGKGWSPAAAPCSSPSAWMSTPSASTETKIAPDQANGDQYR